MKSLLSLVIVAALAVLAAIQIDSRGILDLPLHKVPLLAHFDTLHATEEDAGTPDGGDRPGSQSPEPVVSESKTAVVPAEATPPSADEDEYAKRYPLPPFRSIDDLLENWTKFPPSVFPRKVTLTAPITRTIRAGDGKVIGSTEVPVGTQLVALGAESGMLRLGTSESAAATSTSLAPIEATDFKGLLTDKYEEFKDKVRQQVLSKREAARRRDAELAPPRPSSTTADTPLPSPTRTLTSIPSDDPRFRPMIDSIKSGRYQELEIGSVKSWSWIGPMTFKGKNYDAGIVGFTTRTMFGDLDTEAMALISNGRVTRWVYTGSHEEVQ